MDHFQYLLVLALCVVVTLPLEAFVRVWRRPVRLAKAVLPPLVIFSAWDIAAIAHHQWSFASRYISGVKLPGGLPLEEVLFFLVVPTCAILTFEAVRRVLTRLRQPATNKLVEG